MSLSATSGRKRVVLRARPNLQITESSQGGRRVFVVKDPLALAYFHLEEEQKFLFDRMDGVRTLEDIRQSYEVAFKPRRLSAQELETFAHLLLQRGLVENESAPASLLVERSQQQARARWARSWKSILYLKVPLVDPDRFLDRISIVGLALFRPLGLLAGLAFILWAGLLALTHWHELAARTPSATEFFSWQGVFYLWLSIGLIKVLHELGHGLCAKAVGATVPEMGLALMFFLPTLYCNVSDCWRIEPRRRRLAVSAAGIWVELLLAAGAVFVWRLTVPGHPLNQFSFWLLLACGVNTILFNANPLMRQDGYFILADLLELPNLGQRSQAQLRGHVLGWLGLEAAPDPLPGTPRWLWLYALASLAYRTLVTVGLLALFVTFMKTNGLPWLGTAGVIVVLGLLLGGPVQKFGRELMATWQAGRFVQARPMSRALKLAAVSVLGLVVAVIPWPLSVRSVAMVQVDPRYQQAIPVPSAGGFLDKLLVRAGASVRAGDVLAVLHNPDLERELRWNEAEQALRAEQHQAWLANVGVDGRAGSETLDEIEHERRALAAQHVILKSKKAALTIRAPRYGVILSLKDWETTGKWLAEGEQLFVIGDPSRLRLAVLVDPADRQLVKEGKAVDLLAHGGDKMLTGTVSGVAKIDAPAIPPQLAGRIGGEVATRHDPVSQAEKPMEQHFLVTIDLADNDPRLHSGILGRVRIDAGSATLWWRTRRALASAFAWGI